MRNDLETLRKMAGAILGCSEVKVWDMCVGEKVPQTLGGRDLDAPNPEWHQRFDRVNWCKPFLLWFSSGGSVNRVEIIGESDEIMEVFEK